MRDMPPVVAGREPAAARWRRSPQATVAVLAVSGLVAALEFFVDFPAALMWAAVSGLGVGFIAVFATALGIGWTRGLPWHRSLALALRAGREAICTFF